MATEKPPRISANKLGEYMVATASRRKGIIRDQKRPQPQVSARYRLAIAPVAEFLATGDVDLLHAAAGQLRAASGGSDWALGDRGATAEALEAVGRMRAQLLPGHLVYIPAPQRPQKLLLAGLPVSVQPDMLVIGESRGRQQVGAIKLHYIKKDDSALTTKGAEYVATLLHQWVLAHGPGGRVAAPALSMSVDVFRGAIVAAPASQRRRLADLEAACEEIAGRWPTL